MSDRNKFENWFERELNKHANLSTHMGIYLDVGVSAAWKAWQASANRQGYKLVPADELNRIIADTTDIDTYNDLKAMIGVVE